MGDAWTYNFEKTRHGRSVKRWQYQEISILARLPWRKCKRCMQEVRPLYRRYVLQQGDYRDYEAAFEAVYCKPCIDTLWAEDDAKDTMDALGG